MAGVEQAFGDWQPQRACRRSSRSIRRSRPSASIVIDKPDAVQTEIRVGQLGIPRRHDDFLAMDQAVKILGGEGANRLQQVLRSQRGLTYGASADLETYKTDRRHRRRDRHAHRRDRRSAAADGRRVLQAAARARLRRRARRRAGVSGRQFPADHRDAGRDCHAGAQSAVLRAAARGAADFPGARARA